MSDMLETLVSMAAKGGVSKVFGATDFEGDRSIEHTDSHIVKCPGYQTQADEV